MSAAARHASVGRLRAGQRAFGLSLVLCAATAAGQPRPRTVHAFVALCDNRTQGIVPVPARLGDGDKPADNLYWGARYGLKTYFSRDADWELLGSPGHAEARVLERVVFRSKAHDVYLVADAYRGSMIKHAIADFLDAASGRRKERLQLAHGELALGGDADLLIYVGHNGLMEFELAQEPAARDGRSREVAVLACASQSYFGEHLRRAGARPLLMTTGLLAPEAYVVDGLLDAWIVDNKGAMAARAAEKYAAYQRLPLAQARRIFAAGF